MGEIEFNPAKVDVLRTLYPLFKQEVYERREQMMRIGRFGMAFFLGIMVLGLFFPFGIGSNALRVYTALGVIVFAGLLVFQMRQHRSRHIKAKQAVIEIERALHLFEPGVYLPGKGLYPDEWSHYAGRDGGLALTIASLVLVAVLAVLTLWAV
jgi:uncharacterized protein YhhL (DUF1145 family)